MLSLFPALARSPFNFIFIDRRRRAKLFRGLKLRLLLCVCYVTVAVEEPEINQVRL